MLPRPWPISSATKIVLYVNERMGLGYSRLSFNSLQCTNFRCFSNGLACHCHPRWAHVHQVLRVFVLNINSFQMSTPSTSLRKLKRFRESSFISCVCLTFPWSSRIGVLSSSSAASFRTFEPSCCASKAFLLLGYRSIIWYVLSK